MSAPMATPDRARRRTVLTMEQALSMSYATLRFVHLGWRVIRLEPTPVKGRRSKGDPNRYIGRETPYGEDRHSYFIAPNVGKEAVALNLKEADGRALVRRMVRELPVDIFCTNTLPGHHRDLGIDYDTLRAERDELIWCSISAQGTDYPDVPGYDPVIQAQCGFMDLTGDADGPPLQCGPPVTDLKAGDEAFAQVLLALMERAETGKGKRIDISMAHGALSWMHTFLPMLDMGTPPSGIRRSGNAHRQFIPTNAYATRDGYIYMAIGGDPQWQRLVATPMFRSLDQPRFAGNEGRRKDKVELHGLIEGLTREHPTAAIAEVLTTATIPHMRITPIEEVIDLPFAKNRALRTVAPDGRVVRLPPPVVGTPYLETVGGTLPFAPAYGEHTDAILCGLGVTPTEIVSLRARGVVA